MTTPVRRRLAITGKVQGVWYRGWFREQAEALGLDGWVRNRADGSVEAVVQGPSAAVDAIVRLARQGSPASRVDAVAVSEHGTGEVLSGFEQRATV